MRNSFSIFIVVLFCAVLCVGLGFLNRDSSDALGWNPNELYSNPVLSGESSTFTNASLSSGDVPVGSSVVSMRGGSVSSSPFRHSSSAIYSGAFSSYAPAGVAYGHSSMSNGVSPIAHMTSSAEYRSFGGGGNGGAFGSSSSRHYASAPSSAALSISSPISYIGSSAYDHSSKSYGTSDVSNIQSSMMDNPVVASSSIYGPSSSVADYINTYGSATYDSHDSNGRSNIRGRQNAEGDDDNPWFSDVWWNWFDWQYKKNADGDYLYDHWGTQGADEIWYFTHQDAKAAYEAWCAYMNQQGMAGMLPSYDEWLLWFMNTKGEGNAHEGSNGIYQFIPVGNVLPLLIFALLYVAIMCIKSLRLSNSSNENK